LHVTFDCHKSSGPDAIGAPLEQPTIAAQVSCAQVPTDILTHVPELVRTATPAVPWSY